MYLGYICKLFIHDVRDHGLVRAKGYQSCENMEFKFSGIEDAELQQCLPPLSLISRSHCVESDSDGIESSSRESTSSVLPRINTVSCVLRFSQ